MNKVRKAWRTCHQSSRGGPEGLSPSDPGSECLDNTTALAYIRKQGGTQSLTMWTEVKPTLDWAAQHLAALMDTYILGVTHVWTDFLSRHLLDNEWALHTRVFRCLTEMTVLPEIDLFTTAHNTKLVRFFSRGRCREVEGVGDQTGLALPAVVPTVVAAEHLSTDDTAASPQAAVPGSDPTPGPGETTSKP